MTLRQRHSQIFLEQYEDDGNRFGVLLPTRDAFEEISDDAKQR